MSASVDFNDQTPETKEKWALALAEATMRQEQRPVGGRQVDTRVADAQRAYQALDQDERKEFLLWLVRGAPAIW